VSERHSFSYATVRLVPQAEREEFINVGVIVCSRTPEFLAAKFALDPSRLQTFAPHVDLEEVNGHLESIRQICAGGEGAGPIGRLSRRERFDWLVAPRSTIIQTSAVHTGLCEDPQKALNHLLQTMVIVPRS
jgi:hypothetical protein